MKKVLIISYFSPPCALTSANRIESWLQYLPKANYYPILITRKWSGKELKEDQRLLGTSDGTEIEKLNRGEIYRLPYSQSLRDYFYTNAKKGILFSLLSKFFTIVQLFLQNFTINVIPYKNFYQCARKLLKEDESIKLLIISGNPFEQFFFGYLLKKEFKHLKWVADYRDGWNSSKIYHESRFKFPGLSFLSKRSELKWLGQADMIQTVCPYFAKGLENLHKRRIAVVPNGFGSDFAQILDENLKVNTESPLELMFCGTLYSNQITEPFFKALKNFSKEELSIKFIGSGLEVSSENERLAVKNGTLEILPWIEKQKMIHLMKKTDGFLMFPFNGMKGWPSSKLYDYLPFRKPILLAPSDKDIIEEILVQSGLGIICNDHAEVNLKLRTLIEKKKLEKSLIPNVDIENIRPFSRENAVKELGKVLDSLRVD